MFNSRRLIRWSGVLLGLVAMIFIALTCSSEDVEACPLPPAESNLGQDLALVRTQAGFPVRYPCFLPGGERFEVITFTPGSREQVELIFDGPFEMSIRQSNLPPAVNPDPSGASRITRNLFPNVPVEIIERNDGSRRALYHLYWENENVFYELQAYGPPQQREAVLQVARSLE